MRSDWPAGTADPPVAAATGLVGWTGHPFVDAGLAGLVGATERMSPAEIDVAAVDQAVRRLSEVLLSDQALGVGVESNFATGPLRFLLPNSELVNPANWRGSTDEAKLESVRARFRQGVQKDRDLALACLNGGGGGVACGVCGRARPAEAFTEVRQYQLPLALGAVNFYPSFQWGVRLCGMCALALRFLPVAVMYAGSRNRFWFLHTRPGEVMVHVARRCWRHMDEHIGRNEALDFPMPQLTPGRRGRGQESEFRRAVTVGLLFDMFEGLQATLRRALVDGGSASAYVFTNDPRSPDLEVLPIPQRLLRFVQILYVRDERAARRFREELFAHGTDDSAAAAAESLVAWRMLECLPIAGLCLRFGDNQAAWLRGGWVGHRVYAEQIREIPPWVLTAVEQLGSRLLEHEQSRRYVQELRSAHRNDLARVFLDYVREGWLSYREFYGMAAPNDEAGLEEVRDLLLAYLYDRLSGQAQGAPQRPSQTEPVPQDPPQLQKVAAIGERLARGLPNFPAWLGRLQEARNPGELRGVYLVAARHGCLGFADFVFLCPWGQPGALFERRDYLLAYLYDVTQNAREEATAHGLSGADGGGSGGGQRGGIE